MVLLPLQVPLPLAECSDGAAFTVRVLALFASAAACPNGAAPTASFLALSATLLHVLVLLPASSPQQVVLPPL